LVICEQSINELIEVTKRDREEKLEQVYKFIEENDNYILHNNNYYLSLFSIRDKEDYPILYSAIIGRVDILITNDKDFDEIKIDRPLIMKPKQFIEEIDTKK